VGAADVVDKRSVVANSEAADVTSILAYVRVVLCREVAESFDVGMGSAVGAAESRMCV
jgi:hypothetical protein